MLSLLPLACGSAAFASRGETSCQAETTQGDSRAGSGPLLDAVKEVVTSRFGTILDTACGDDAPGLERCCRKRQPRCRPCHPAGSMSLAA
jgi:hypothetical protein